MWVPDTVPGILAAAVLALAGVTVLFTTGLGPALIVLGLGAGLAYLLYALGTRLHTRITTPNQGGER